MKKKILITGSNGLLGQKLVTLLLPNADVELLATSRGENKLAALFPQLPFVSLDVTNPDEVKNVVVMHQPTHIIHTAAMTNVDECEVNREACWKLNVDAVAYLVQAAEANNVHFTHLSTDFIFDGLAGPYNEEAEANPISYYGESKLAAEQLVQKSSARWAIVRTVLVYGIVHDYGRSNIVLWVKNSLEGQKPIKVVDDQFRTPTLAEDLALGCWLIADQDAEGVFNISSKELITPYDMAMQVADYFKLDASYITRANASSFTQTARRPARTGFIISKAEEQLGFRPHTFTEGIAVVASQLPV